jgi:hypothetical protein
MILNIGLAKTGTTTYAEALTILGFPTKHDALKVISGNNYSGLLSWRVEELMNLYPSATFFCSTRDFSSWILSCEKYFSRVRGKTVLKQFGVNKFDLGKFTEVYNNYHAFVKKLDIPLLSFEDGWSPLCNLLKVKVPQEAFPYLHINGKNLRGGI